MLFSADIRISRIDAENRKFGSITTEEHGQNQVSATDVQCESKNPPYGFLNFFPKRLGIFNQFFTHLLCDHFYTRLQIFILLSLTLTKLCHTKRDHLANFYISLEL